MTSTLCDPRSPARALAACLGLLALSAVVSGAQAPTVQAPRDPWVLVGEPDPLEWDALASPHVLVLPDGRLLATFEHQGHHGSNQGVHVFRSSDRGATWSSIARLTSPRASSLFAIGAKLYLVGVDGSGLGARGRSVIRSSTDGGATWTEPTSEATGLLRGETILESDDVPVLVARGRVWRPFGRRVDAAEPGAARVHLLVASASLDADLLRADAWRWSEGLAPPSQASRLAGSLLVAEPESGPCVLLRDYGGESLGTARVSEDGLGLAMSNGAEVRLPERMAHCTNRIESVEGAWFSLAFGPFVAPNASSVVAPSDLATGDRDTVELCTSMDRVTWASSRTLLRAATPLEGRLGPCDWTLDGGDLLLVACARGPGISVQRGRSRANASLLFLRVPRFREHSPDAPSIPAPTKPK